MLKRVIGNMALGCLSLIPKNVATKFLSLVRSRPEITDRWGYHIRPIHYYEPVPDFREMTPERLGRRRFSPAIDFAIEHQKQLAGRLAQAFGDEIAKLAAEPEPIGFDFRNQWFSDLDASIYYSLIRDLRPKRVVEIGAGFSSRIADKALSRNRSEGHPGELTCIEPYPSPRLTEAKLKFRLVETRVEDLDIDFFSCLESGDILLIDSSHVVKFGSDVCREFLEILPRLKAGVWVHVHDIFIPYEYPTDWLVNHRLCFNEQYLLEAFLEYNNAFSVQLANHWLRRENLDLVSKLIPRKNLEMNDQVIGSFWMRKDA